MHRERGALGRDVGPHPFQSLSRSADIVGWSGVGVCPAGLGHQVGVGGLMQQPLLTTDFLFCPLLLG